MNVLELADSLWRGESDIVDHHPLILSGDLVEVAEGVAFVPSFANVTAFSTTAGLVLVDTGSAVFADSVHERIRAWSDERVDTAIFTHGHIDHVFGLGPFEEEGPVRVVAHEGVVARFERYVLTAGYNGVINSRQFGTDVTWPTDYRFPDETYREWLDLSFGDETFELHHAAGETDDHTWVWVPSREVLCCGDLFIWACPNAGNPQKVQRFAQSWAEALHEMAELDAEVMLPGHGFPIVGADRVRTALTDAAELLESLLAQSLELINEGATLDEVIHTVRAPEALLDKPYLKPVYDEPEFIVRNIWRQYAGWYDGDPATLKPAPAEDLAAELASLAGGANVLAQRAAELARAGDLRLAGNLAQTALLAAPDDAAVRTVYEDVFTQRAEAESSTMAKGIFGDAARTAGG